ncbi:MAG: YfhO family protein [Oscillospiraceae bacterium]|jgi:uncharacterized membrane protein YfhO|nr:YfhO family protein [Oscillospiraceae bacterium]
MPLARDSRRRKAFLLALIMAAVIFVPFIIYDRGYFIYYGDFNVQQIPFYKLAHESVRSGNLFWSFYTDLGANFIGSYSFYLLFSPFFWLTLPFPTAFLPHLMAPLLILKTACASLTAYLYLERFLRDRDYALFGGILYAFSGWMFFNVFFNHFHEVAIFFPLLLLGVEKLVLENKRGFFAAAVAVNALVNYWFFVGEVVFVVLYVIIRMTDRRWGMTLRGFLALGLESVLGVFMAAAVLIPSVMALSGNPRTGADSLLNGWNFWIYWNTQSQASILQSLFFPPELPARLNFFPDSTAPWSSRSAWLPLMGLTGVLAFFFERKGDWVKKILAVSLVFALVPGLNALFILLNHSYYARWFYMPVLLMCLATARSLESSAKNTDHFLRAVKWCMAITLCFILICGVTPKVEKGEVTMGLIAYPNVFWVFSVFSMICLLVIAVLIARLRNHANFKRFLAVALAVCCVSFGIYYIAQGKNNRAAAEKVISTAIGGREMIHLPDDETPGAFSRIDFFEGSDNLGMFWRRPTIQAFHSIVPPSLMEFYPFVGVERDVASRPEADNRALRPLLSVRWLFAPVDSSSPGEPPVEGFAFHSEQPGFNLYENQNYIPMGYGYENYVLREDIEKEDARNAHLMLKAVILEDWDSVERCAQGLDWLDIQDRVDYGLQAMGEDAAQRRAQSCYYFAHDSRGFTARSNLEKDTLMFFSVPWDKGWSASVNGAPVKIERVNVGFMAVSVPAGESEIRFDYFTPGLKEGAVITAVSLAAFLIYLRLFGKNKKELAAKNELKVRRALFAAEAVDMSWEEYLGDLRKNESAPPAAQAAQKEEPEPLALPDSERTLPFSQEEGQARD